MTFGLRSPRAEFVTLCGATVCEAGRSIWRSRWAPDIDCHSKSLGEWRFIFPICTRHCATIKAQLALRRQWFAFTNHVGSVLIASTSGRGALLSPRARCLWSFVSTFFLIDYTRTIFHSPPGFSGHLIELPNAAPPRPVLFSKPQMASAHTSVLSRQSAQTTPEGCSANLANSRQKKNAPSFFTPPILDLHVHYIQSNDSYK